MKKSKEELIIEFDKLYPHFEKNVNTWVNYKYYRQVPNRLLKDLAQFLNDYVGKTIYTCVTCNCGAMLTKLNDIKNIITNEREINKNLELNDIQDGDSLESADTKEDRLTTKTISETTTKVSKNVKSKNK